MDRHQFVESLIKKRDDLSTKLAELKEAAKLAFDRSREGIARLLEKTEPASLAFNSAGGGDVLLIHDSNGNILKVAPSQAERVSDDAIIELCGEICELRRQCDKEKQLIRKYEADEVASQLRAVVCEG